MEVFPVKDPKFNKTLNAVIDEVQTKYEYKLNEDTEMSMSDFTNTMRTIENYVKDNAIMIYQVGLKINGFALARNNVDLIFCTTCGKIGIFDTVKRIIKEDAVLSDKSLMATLLTPDEKFIIASGVCRVLKIYTYPELNHYKDLEGHEGNVIRLIRSPDQKWFYSCSEDSTVRKWDLSSLSGGEVLMKHEGQAKSLVIDPNNRYLFSGGEDLIIRVYDLLQNKEIQQLKGHEKWVWALAVSPDNKTLASGSSDCNIKLWSLENFSCIRTMTGHLNRMTMLQFSPDNKFLVSSSADNTVRIWPLAIKAEAAVLSGHDNWVKALMISPDQKFIYSAGEDRSFRIWSFPTDMKCEDLTVHNDTIKSLCVSDDSKRLISLDKNEVKIWDIETNEPLKTLRLPILESGETNVSLTCCKRTPYNDQLVVGDSEGVIYVYDLLYFNMLKSTKAHNSEIIFIEINSRGDKIVTTGTDFRMIIFSLATLNKEKSFRGSDSLITSAIFTADCKFLLSGHANAHIKVWDADDVQILHDLYKDKDDLYKDDCRVTHILITRDSEMLISGDSKGRIIIWDYNQKIIEREWKTHEKSIVGLNLCGLEHYLISADSSGKFGIWDLKTRQMLVNFKFQDINLFCLDTIEKTIYYACNTQVKFVENPMKCSDISLYGMGQKREFVSYLNKILVQKNIPDYRPEMENWVIFPFKINILHIYTFSNMMDHVKKSLDTNFTLINSDKRETALSIALYRNSFDLVDCIINRVVREVNHNRYIIRAIEECIILLNDKGNKTLPNLYESMMVESTDITLPRFCIESKKYPIYNISESQRINPDLFSIPRADKNEGNLILFKESLIKVILYPGSKMSIEFLRSLNRSPEENIFGTDYVQSILLYKWELLGNYMRVQTAVYIAYMILLCAQTTSKSENPVLIGLIFVFNSMLLLFELFQIFVVGKQYWKGYMNYLDILRSTTCLLYYAFLLAETDEVDMYSLFIVVHVSSWLRGIAYFRIFKTTRYMINLIREVLNDIKSFLLILLYSTLSFSFIFFVTKKDEEYNHYLNLLYDISLGGIPYDYKEKAFEFIMLTVAVIINPIIMLNLLISIIGDTFDRVQSRRIIADMRELSQIIIEIEQLLFWRRNLGLKNYIQVCNTRYSKEEIGDQWEGEIKEIDNRLVTLINKNSDIYDKIIKLENDLGGVIFSVNQLLEKQHAARS
jgi:WD40 repeat protein